MVQRVNNKPIDLVISKLNQSNVCMGGDENPLFAFLRLLMIGSISPRLHCQFAIKHLTGSPFLNLDRCINL